MVVNRFAIALLMMLAPAALGAQVGHLPDESPYRDVPYRHELTTYSGWYTGAEGSAGVGPQAGPLAGLSYDIRIGGPAFFSAHAAYVFSQRNVIDPLNPPETRSLGTKDVGLVFLDAGITLNITGQKSWHGIVPYTRFGAGLVMNVGGQADPAGFTIGTPFALVFGGGLRWTSGGWLQLRLDATDHLFQLSYPSSYTRIPEGGGRPVLLGDTEEWTNNGVFTIGASFIISR